MRAIACLLMVVLCAACGRAAEDAPTHTPLAATYGAHAREVLGHAVTIETSETELVMARVGPTSERLALTHEATAGAAWDWYNCAKSK